MTLTYTVTTDDVHLINGCTAARDAYNAAIPEAPTPSEPGPFATNEAYMQFVNMRALQSYAEQYGT